MKRRLASAVMATVSAAMMCMGPAAAAADYRLVATDVPRTSAISPPEIALALRDTKDDDAGTVKKIVSLVPGEAAIGDTTIHEASQSRAGTPRGVQVPEVPGFEFELNEESITASVQMYSSNETSVIIPEKIDYGGKKYTVTAIGDYAFKVGNGNLTSITIPTTVVSIGTRAFQGLNTLEEVQMSEGLLSIGTAAFEGCSALKSLTIPQTVTSIEALAFQSCSALEDVSIPDRVNEIAPNTFAYCSSLKEIRLPNGITGIGEDAFYGCGSLASVTLPDSLTHIDLRAFYSCSSLTSIALPNSVAEIGDRAFYSCSALVSVSLPNSVTTLGEAVFGNCVLLETITVPGSVGSISNSAFAECTSLESVMIEEGVTYIDASAFFSCESLTTISIPGSVTRIGEAAFMDCSSLTSVVIPDGVTEIGGNAFENCSMLAFVAIPGSIVGFSGRAFAGCYVEDVLFSGSEERWEELGDHGRLDSAIVWCTDGDTVVGTISDYVKIESTVPENSDDIYGGEVIPITASFARPIPDGAKLPITIKLNGLTTSKRKAAETSTELTPNHRAATYECAVTAGMGETITATITSAGHQSDYSDQLATWSSLVAYAAPVVSVSCDADGAVIAGQSITVTVSCENIPPDGLIGTLQLQGLTALQGVGAVTLTESSPSQSVSCTVDSGVSSVSAQMTGLQTGDKPLAVAVPALNLSVLSPSVRVACSPSGTVSEGESVTLTVTGTDIPPQGVSGTVTMTGLSSAERESAASFELTSTAGSAQIQCVAEAGVSEAEAWISQLRAGTQSLTPPSEKVTLTVTSANTVTPDDPSEESPESPSPGASSSPPSETTQNPEPIESPSAAPSQIPVSSSGTAQDPSTGPVSSSGTGVPAPSAEASSSPDSSGTVLMPVVLKPDASSMPEGVTVVENADGSGSSLIGVVIGSLWGASPAKLIESWINGTVGADNVRVVRPGGEAVGPDQQVATGMMVQVISGSAVVRETTIVVKGDVLGTGEISLSQVVRLAKAYTDADPLEGAYEQAGDLTGDGEIQLSDVIQEAKMYIGDTLEVNYSVVDKREDVAELLDTTGYDISPWTDEVAVLAADIPEGAEISSIAWTQRDVFPDGREQELYYEGPEETLVFGTYTEGRTIVTAVVTTASGKTGSHSTELVWDGIYTSPERPAEAGERAAARPAATPSEGGTQTPSSAASAAVTPAASSTIPGTAVPSASVGTSSPTASGTPSASAVHPSASASVSPVPMQSTSPQATASAAPSQAAGTTFSPQATASVSASAPATGAPSPVDLLTTFRIEVVVGTNGLRANNDIRPMLIPSTRLSEAAMVRAQEMAHAGKLSHTRPDGSKYSTVVELGKGIVIGENIHSNRGYPTLEVAQIAVHGWENSAPHRKQILEGRYTHTGIGFFESDEGKWYCVQVFSNGDKVLSIDTPKA